MILDKSGKKHKNEKNIIRSNNQEYKFESQKDNIDNVASHYVKKSLT